MDTQQIFNTIRLIDDRLTSTVNSLETLRSIQVQETTISYDFYSSAELKFEGLIKSVGLRPKELNPSFNALDLCLAVSSLISRLTNLSSDIKRSVDATLLSTNANLSTGQTKSDLDRTVENILELIRNQALEIKRFGLAIAEEFSNQMQSVAGRLVNIEKGMNSHSSPTQCVFHKMFVTFQRLYNIVAEEIVQFCYRNHCPTMSIGKHTSTPQQSKTLSQT